MFSALPSRLNGFIFIFFLFTDHWINKEFFICPSIQNTCEIFWQRIYLSQFISAEKKGMVKGQCIINALILYEKIFYILWNIMCPVSSTFTLNLFSMEDKKSITAFDMPIMCTRSKSNVFGPLCCFLFCPQSANIQTVYYTVALERGWYTQKQKKATRMTLNRLLNTLNDTN